MSESDAEQQENQFREEPSAQGESEQPKSKRRVRTISVNFPHNVEASRLYEEILKTAENESRSISNVVYLIIRNALDNQED